ncbi:RNA helicase [Spiromyces aspiralis]|uniref:RNA helicase n=1 Tax=Spiromyces aspiralis TaxID=68401 RepID=A0ACC1HDY3_9FUNG|nr:RNA helicase [Spiromyces aspiralis]
MNISEDMLDEALAAKLRNRNLRKFCSDPQYEKRCEDLGLSRSAFRKWKDAYVGEVEANRIETLTPESLIPVILREGPDGIGSRLVPNFLSYLERVSPEDMAKLKNIRAVTDCRYQEEWNVAARMMQRKVIMHVGPTNSGKTHTAIERLKEARNGIYCSPLRLLAHEVYLRMNRMGKPCQLITGEERRQPEVDGVPIPVPIGPYDEPMVPLTASTIEMANMAAPYDVAVIDEIQMISDMQRGWAWVQALQGLQAKEIHLCGEPTAVPLVKRLFAAMSEDVEVYTYDRLSPLKVDRASLNGKWSNIRKGDCVVTFSRDKIFQTKRLIEKATGMKCAVIYGALPPGTRAEQARLFNDSSSGYDVMVASDAVGMGLNLNIQRVVFETMYKYDGDSMKPISISQTRQIGGRAGRFKSMYDCGVVTTFEKRDIPLLEKKINASPAPIASAGFKPPTVMVETLSRHFPKVPFAKLWAMFKDCANLGSKYHICSFKDSETIANAIEEVPLLIKDRYQFMYAPIQTRDSVVVNNAVKFAKALAARKPCHVADFVELPSTVPKSKEELLELESTHRTTILYLWLHFHYPTIYIDVEEAQELKVKCEQMIQNSLTEAHNKRKSKMRGAMASSPPNGKKCGEIYDNATSFQTQRPDRCRNQATGYASIQT